LPYYLAIKAISENRLEDASDWLQISMETGMMMYGEYRWSNNLLYQWNIQGRSLPLIEMDIKAGKLE